MKRRSPALRAADEKRAQLNGLKRGTRLRVRLHGKIATVEFRRVTRAGTGSHALVDAGHRDHLDVVALSDVLEVLR